MGSTHTPADDVVYDLISIQYHALKAGQAYGKYEQDAHGHGDVEAFIRECKEQDAARAQRAHELLRDLTGSGGIG